MVKKKRPSLSEEDRSSIKGRTDSYAALLELSVSPGCELVDNIMLIIVKIWGRGEWALIPKWVLPFFFALFNRGFWEMCISGELCRY